MNDVAVQAEDGNRVVGYILIQRLLAIARCSQIFPQSTTKICKNMQSNTDDRPSR